MIRERAVWLAAVLAALATVAASVSGQEVPIRELTVHAGDAPVRVLGYGLVVGLDGTGDRVVGVFSSGHTVRSVANLLRRFGVEVPEEMLRTRNVAAVLVTAELSAYLRPGGRFDVQVASVGDASSLRGGVLWATPLQVGPGVPPVATAQGSLIVSDPDFDNRYSVQTTANVPAGGLLDAGFPAPGAGLTPVLYLKDPDLTTASRIAAAVREALGDSAAVVDDPGSVTLRLPQDSTVSLAEQLTEIGELRVSRARRAQVIIDGRGGTVVAGGDVRVGEAVVSHGAMTLAIGGTPAPDGALVPGDLRFEPGVTVQDVAGVLQGVAATPAQIAAIFESLREVGAITAEVRVR